MSMKKLDLKRVGSLGMSVALVAVIAVAVVACGPAPANEPTATPPPSPTEEPVATALPAPTNTPAPMPTATKPEAKPSATQEVESTTMQPKQYDTPPEMVIDPKKSYSAVFKTEKGDFRVKLFAEKSSQDGQQLRLPGPRWVL